MTNKRQDLVIRGLGLNSDNCIPVAGFLQTDTCNEGGGLEVLSLDKNPIKTGQYVFLPTTGWYIHEGRARHAGGSAGHRLLGSVLKHLEILLFNC